MTIEENKLQECRLAWLQLAGREKNQWRRSVFAHCANTAVVRADRVACQKKKRKGKKKSDFKAPQWLLAEIRWMCGRNRLFFWPEAAAVGQSRFAFSLYLKHHLWKANPRWIHKYKFLRHGVSDGQGAQGCNFIAWEIKTKGERNKIAALATLI